VGAALIEPAADCGRPEEYDPAMFWFREEEPGRIDPATLKPPPEEREPECPLWGPRKASSAPGGSWKPLPS
jgi:hypothetical protein